MSYWKEIYNTSQWNSMNSQNPHKDFDMWESGVIDTLRVMPKSVLKDLTKTSELGYYAKIVLSSKGETE